MKLANDWKLIFKKAWSVRLLIVAALLSGVEVVLPFLSDCLPRGPFAAASFIAVAGAFVARLVAQKEFTDEVKP